MGSSLTRTQPYSQQRPGLGPHRDLPDAETLKHDGGRHSEYKDSRRSEEVVSETQGTLVASEKKS